MSNKDNNVVVEGKKGVVFLHTVEEIWIKKAAV